MQLEFESPHFALISGLVLLVPGPLHPMAGFVFQDGRAVKPGDLGQEVEINTVPLANGIAKEITVAGPGPYLCQLTDVEVVDRSDSKEKSLIRIAMHEIQLTAEDLSEGVAKISIGPTGLVRLRVTDKRGEARAHQGINIVGGDLEGCIEPFTNSRGETGLIGLPEGAYQATSFGRAPRKRFHVRAGTEMTILLQEGE